MHLLAVCEDTPDASATTSNGSTMVSAWVLRRLPADVQIDLVCFDDGRRRLDPEVEARCLSVVRLPLRSARTSFVRSLVSPLPRSTWRRSGRRAAETVARLAEAADVLYVHGPHAFGVAAEVQARQRRPAVFSELDHWSENVRQRCDRVSGPRRWYGLLQARRTQCLERLASAVADSYVVVAAPDARGLERQLARRVDAVPNGVTVSDSDETVEWDGSPTLGFLGSLDYPPNIDAVTRLVTEVLPLVQARLPHARVVVAGRHPGPQVERFVGPAVSVLGEVPDAGAFYRSVGVMVYPGTLGTGTKNTVAEATAAGAVVVASTVAARNQPVHERLLLADDAPTMADAVVRALEDVARRGRRPLAGSADQSGAMTWDEVAARYDQMLRGAVSASRAVSPTRGG